MTNLNDLNNRRSVNQHAIEAIKNAMRAEERLTLLATHGDNIAAYALDNALTRLTRITNTIKEQK